MDSGACKSGQEGKQIVSVGLIQTVVSEDMTENLKKTVAKVEEAAGKGAQIVCLQELYRTRYFPQEENQAAGKFAETIPGESTNAFAELAKKHKIVIIVPLFEKHPNGKYYNSVVVIDANGKTMETYHKVHVPQDPLFYEKNYFEAGDLGYKVYKTAYANFGVLICYDQWFPEAARINVLKGADIIFYPTAIGWIKGHTSADGDWHNAWQTIQRSHAIANGVHIAAVNRVGEENQLEFWGGSFVCNSFGEILGEASAENEEVLVVKVDLGKNVRIRDGWGFLKNRRPDTYQLLTEDNTSNNIMRNDGLPTCKNPSALGYRMPAEWEKHDAIWLSWPHDPTTFPDRVEKVENTYVQIIKNIHESEYVNLFVKDEDMKEKAIHLFKQEGLNLDRIRFFQFDYADVWFRDYGPIFVVNNNSELAMVHWIFNTWGEKYADLLKDNQIPQIINRDMRLSCFKPGIVLEGGSIDVNGKGALLTTEQCLLNKNRNPHLNKEEIETFLKDHLGVTHVIWLKNGIYGDDTDGHIDDLARFVNPATIVCAYEEDKNDENHAILKENYELLLKAVDQDGNKLNIVKLPMPGAVHHEEKRLPASYTNFYVGNGRVLVPIFNHENDKVALSILQKLFPDRKVVGIYCADLVHGLGTIHCISQQQPSTTYS
jgi:agmatine deiminase